MTIIGVTADGKKISKVTQAGPASYTTGGFSVTVTDLNHVDQILVVSNNGGYLTNSGDASASGSAVTVLVRMFQYANAATGVAAEAAAATDMSATTFTVIATGN
jgi:hypothetical protein